MKRFLNKWLFLFTLFIHPLAFSHEKWENFLGNQSCTPLLYCEPKNFEELRKSLHNVVLQNYPVRVVGSGFSINDICCCKGCLLNLKHLNNIFIIDEENKTVRVEAGITLQKLNEKLAHHDLTLPNQAAIDQITLGGAISTGVHGTGHTGTLSNSVLEIELLAADGRVYKLSEVSDPNGFAAAKLSLGTLGVIYALTIQCTPLFYLEAATESRTIDDLLKNYPTLFEKNDFFQFSWNVETGKAIITCWNKTAKGIPAHKALPFYEIDPKDKDLFSEIAIPIDLLPKAIEKTKLFVDKCKKSGAIVSDITIRFVEADSNVYLSPAKGKVAYITFSLSERDKFLNLYREFENALLEYGGRPHWGKTNFLDHEKVKRLYGDDFQKFSIEKQKFDPQGVFSNDFIRRIWK